MVIKKKEKSDVQIPECVVNFQDEFRTYLEETQKGNININTINKLISLLNEIETTQDSDVKIDFSTNELKILLQKIFEFTENVVETTKILSVKLNAPTNDSSKNIIYLKDYLLAQKKIAEKEA